MPSGLVNIISHGCDDLYLTGSPQITFFKIVYRRYTNFSIESIRIELDEEIKFGRETEIKIPKIGDCISKTYIEIELPETIFTKIDAGINEEEIEIIEYDDEAEQNYNTIIEFMELNVQAYRTAINDYNAENETAQNMIDNIRQVFTDASVAEGSSTGGSTIDTKTQAYRLLIDSFVIEGKIKYVNSDLSNVILTMVDEENNILIGITKEEIISKVINAIKNSIKYQEFFFNTYNEYLKEYEDSKSINLKFAWIRRIGHEIIEYIEVYIGGEKIDTHYGQFMDIWYELTGNRKMESIYMKMIGDVSILTKFDKNIKPKYKLVIPLQFWFTRRIGLALPIVAMQYSDISLKIKLKEIESCAYIEQIEEITMSLSDMWENKGNILKCNLMVDYIYLENRERKKFAQSVHEYLIDTTEVLTIEDITKMELNIKLDFKNPSKEIIWVLQKTAYIKTKDSVAITKSENYSINTNNVGHILKSCKIDFNGYTRIEPTIGLPNFFNYLQPYIRHKNTPADGIYVYSFSLFPEEHQPSGTCNFSAIDNVSVIFNFNDNSFIYKKSDIYPHIIQNSIEDTTETTSIILNIYNIKYNILRIVSGFGGLAFI